MSKTVRRGSRADRVSATLFETPISLLDKRASFELIPVVRQKCVDMYEQNRELYDERDIKRIEYNDWSVQRFIEYNRNSVEEAFQQLDDTLKWRKSKGVNDRSLGRDCGKELYNIGGLVHYNEDKNGRPVLYLRVKCNRKVPQLRPVIEQFFIDVINRLDEEANQRGYVLVIDFTDAGLSNVNLDLLKFMISTMKNYFPLGLRCTINYNFPWILRNIWSIVNTWLGDYKKLVKFANDDEIKNFIDDDQLPKHLGGSCAKSFVKAPDGCPSVYDLSHNFGISGADVSKYLKVYADLIEEAKHFQ